MTYSSYVLAASFYVKGDNVDPENISQLFGGLQCTKGWQKGERKGFSSEGKSIIAKTGVWVLESNLASNSIAAHLEYLAKTIKVTKTEIDLAIGINNSFFDLFIAMNAAEENCPSSLHFVLTPEIFSRLNFLGFPVEFTFDYVSK